MKRRARRVGREDIVVVFVPAAVVGGSGDVVAKRYFRVISFGSCRLYSRSQD